MCLQCVSQSLPYVAVALGGLRLQSWRGIRARLDPAPSAAIDDDRDHDLARDTSAADAGRMAGAEPRRAAPRILDWNS